MSTDPNWCRENPREAAADIDRLNTRVADLLELVAAWRAVASALRRVPASDATCSPDQDKRSLPNNH